MMPKLVLLEHRRTSARGEEVENIIYTCFRDAGLVDRYIQLLVSTIEPIIKP